MCTVLLQFAISSIKGEAEGSTWASLWSKGSQGDKSAEEPSN